MPRDDESTANPAEVLALDPLSVPGLITPIQTPGAIGGVNRNMIYASAKGLLVQLLPYVNMQGGDWVEVFWDNDDVPVATAVVLPEQEQDSVPLYIPANRVPEGLHPLYARVTRQSGNQEETAPLHVLVRTLLPGGFDPEPDLPGHQNLAAPEPELPPSGIIDEEAAKNGVKVTIPGYPNIRQFDTLTFSWGGVQFTYEVTAADVQADQIELLVDEATILAAGASDALVLVYWVWDEVHNLASDWSMRTLVTVEIGEDLFDAPMIENPDDNADPYDVIDLDELGEDDLVVAAMVYNNGLLIGDVITLTWTGTTAQGLPVTFTPPPETVNRDPQAINFLIPNADVRVLGGGRGVASYTVTRNDAPAGVSKRAFVTFVGAEQRLPKPQLPDAEDGVLAPDLEQTTVIIPGEALEAGDIVYLVWLGTRANGSPLLHEDSRNVSGGSAGQPMPFTVPGQFIAPLDGGTLSVYYRLYKRSIGMELESDREHLRVGESQAELPAPTTDPAAVDGVLDPAQLPAVLTIIVPHWPGMNDRQTVHLVWRASGGGNHDDFMPISAPMVGKDVVFHMDRETVEAYRDKDIQLSYWVETPGEASQVSGVLRFKVGTREEIESGPFRVMGARWDNGSWGSRGQPKMLSALRDTNLQPMQVAWRYETDEQWTVATRWIDRKPGLKLYVRSSSETWLCNPLNIIGTGTHLNDSGNSAFVAMRDEVSAGGDIEVDAVAWGNPDCGGAMEPEQIAVKNVAQLTATVGACAARLRDGDVICWGPEYYGGMPRRISGNFVELAATGSSFAGRTASGELFAWGNGDHDAVPIPDHVLQYQDYRHVYPGGVGFCGLRENGKVVPWGRQGDGGELLPDQAELDGVEDVLGNNGAYVALRDSGTSRSVFAWGNAANGGLLPDEVGREHNVASLAAATHDAFCIQLKNGELMVWPLSSQSGSLPQELVGVTNVVEVSATQEAFCARLDSGKVVAWGNPQWGGTLPRYVADKTDIIQVANAMMAFAALCRDGTVVTWGKPECGGDSSSVAEQLFDVRALYGNGSGFTALTSDGRVVTWGVPAGGGDSSKVQSQLRGKVTHSRLLPPAEAVAQGTASNTQGEQP